MNLKLIGALLIIAGFGSAGLMKSMHHYREEDSLQQLIRSIEFMECELKFRMTPLPALCQMTAEQTTGPLRNVWRGMAERLGAKNMASVHTCWEYTLQASECLPLHTKQILRSLGSGLGRFDAEGQLKGLAMTKELCTQRLSRLSTNRDARLRSYRTIGFCMGLAFAILLF